MAVIPAMRVLALWLAAFWLPLTLHCELAVMFNGCCEEHSGYDNHSCCGEGGQCETLVCKVLKTGDFWHHDTKEAVPETAMDCTAFQDFYDLRSEPAPAGIINETTGAPPDGLRRWQFIFRAAAPPRAPSACC